MKKLEMNIKTIALFLILNLIIIVQIACDGDSADMVINNDGNGLRTAQSTIKQWGMFERVLTSTNRYSNAQKYNDVTLSATFNGPAGVSYTAPGFWDGGNTWRIRFSPIIPGKWSYSINSSDDNLDSSANDGSFICVTPSTAEIAANPNYRGFLKVHPSKKYLTYADGTPFFWMGGTIWDSNSKNMPYATDFKTYVDNRKEKKFSVIQILVGHPGINYDGGRYTGWNENGPMFHRPSVIVDYTYRIVNKILRTLNFNSQFWDYRYNEINPESFKNLDLRIQYLIEKGIVPYIVFGWAWDYKAMSTWSLQNYVRYVVARYQAYNVIWCVAGEHYLSDDKSEFRKIGNYVNNLDALDHLTTIHGWGTGEFRDEDWVDFVSDVSWDLPSKMYNQMLQNFYNPRLPFVMTESRYVGNEPDSNYKVLKYAWETFMAGALGYTYGVEEIRAWDHKWNGVPYEGGQLIYTPGLSRSRLDIPSSFQMKYIVEFFCNKEWWKLVPNNDLVDRGRCLTDLGKRYVVWLNGGGPVTVDLSNASDTLSVEWFNPLTGKTTDGGTAVGGASRSFTPPFKGDAVLYIGSKSH